MNVNIDEEIRNYIIKEVEYVLSPVTLAQYRFIGLTEQIDILLRLLSYEIEYEGLSRVGQNFRSHIQNIINGDLNSLPIAIEGLAANFEAFLKKIGYLRYYGTSIWNGDDESKGIKETMFYDLVNGKIEGKKPKMDIPEPLVDNCGIKKEILDFVRTNLRNAVHNAPSYKKTDLLPFSYLVISCYLFTIEKNLLFLKNILLPEYRYLQKIINQKGYISLDKVYVELLGQESCEDIEMIGIQIKDEFKLLSNVETFSSDSEDIDYDLEDQFYVDNIMNIIRENKNLIIIGIPGSGKSTTLQKVLYSKSKQIIEGSDNFRFPFYIAANEFRIDRSFRDILNTKLDKSWITCALEAGRIQILIDGLNEIVSDYKHFAINEIKNLMALYPNVSFIITDRKYGYQKSFEIPTFELKNLSENQIKEFIIKNSNEIDSENIWRNLIENNEMLELASNPLMLKMILSVIKDNTIPESKGQLFRLFLNTIFLREEKKKKQFDREIKNEILAHIAFNMRNTGTISLPSKLFNNFLLKSIQKTNYNISPTLLSKELFDNNIIKTSENDDISFLHETYQEYFCSLYLNGQFIVNEELEIDLKNPIWVEPVLLCNELFKKDSDHLKFFEYLFRGQKELNPAKHISEINESDYNPYIYVASKVANKHKKKDDELYSTCKRFLKNYMALSKIHYIKEDRWPIPLENLFNSISSLNSSELLKQIFIDPFWVQVWLYSNIDEESLPSLNKRTIQIKNGLFNCLTFTIIENTPNYSILIEVIDESEKENIWFKSVRNNLKIFKKNLLQSIPVKELIEYYKERVLDDDLLLGILKQEPDFASKYSFQKNNKVTNTKVIQVLSLYHHQNSSIRELIINELTTNIYRANLYSKVAVIFYNNNHIDDFQILVEYIYRSRYSIFDEIIPILQKLPFSRLSSILRNAFIHANDSTTIPYKRLPHDLALDYVITDSCYINIVNKLISQKEGVLINNSERIEILSHKPINILSNYLLTAKPINSRANSLNLPMNGIITFNIDSVESNLKYVDCKTSKSGDKINFSLDISSSFHQPFLQQNDIILVNGLFEMCFLSFTTILEASSEIKVFIKHNNLVIPPKGLISANYLIDYTSPLEYHPDILINSNHIDKIRKDFTVNTDIQVIKEFVLNVGMSYRFIDLLDQTNFGILVHIYKNTFKVYSLSECKFIEVRMLSDEIDNFKLYDIVVIERNGKLNLLDNNCDLNKVGFKESEIVNINNERREGFILNDQDNDYYFHFNSCDFLPMLGDKVRFIPAKNPMSKYQNLPVALLISKLERPICIIYDVYKDDNQKYIRGKAYDVSTNEHLFFSTNFNALKYISNLATNGIEIQQYFEYSILKESEGDLNKVIKLMKHINLS